MVIVSPEGRYLAANRTFCDYLGYTEQELLGRTVESVTLPEDWQEFAEKLQEALMQDRGFQWLQKRCLHKSGVIVYTESSTTLIRSREGSPQFFIAHVLDITQRKKAEEALSGMTQKLIEAQEQERARIARELHDDVSQQLALLAVELDRWNQSSDDVNLHDHIQNTRRRIIEISQDVQSLSHQLHSSKLEYLGLVAAANGFSKEISEKNGVLVEFREDGVPRTLPNEVSLALFRILQQALHNAVEHSGTKQVEVRLWRQSDEVHLTVKDFGQGFVVSAMQNIGLGLTSMRQRARLVNGEVAIDSKPMCGTTIHARIPLLCEPHAEKRASCPIPIYAVPGLTGCIRRGKSGHLPSGETTLTHGSTRHSANRCGLDARKQQGCALGPAAGMAPNQFSSNAPVRPRCSAPSYAVCCWWVCCV
jgi:PAS domain S-box-containing protein